MKSTPTSALCRRSIPSSKSCFSSKSAQPALLMVCVYLKSKAPAGLLDGAFMLAAQA
jgi:hypothetical protein